jgi:hypothetical protein
MPVGVAIGPQSTLPDAPSYLSVVTWGSALSFTDVPLTTALPASSRRTARAESAPFEGPWNVMGPQATDPSAPAYFTVV